MWWNCELCVFLSSKNKNKHKKFILNRRQSMKCEIYLNILTLSCVYKENYLAIFFFFLFDNCGRNFTIATKLTNLKSERRSIRVCTCWQPTETNFNQCSTTMCTRAFLFKMCDLRFFDESETDWSCLCLLRMRPYWSMFEMWLLCFASCISWNLERLQHNRCRIEWTTVNGMHWKAHTVCLLFFPSVCAKPRHKHNPEQSATEASYNVHLYIHVSKLKPSACGVLARQKPIGSMCCEQI